MKRILSSSILGMAFLLVPALSFAADAGSGGEAAALDGGANDAGDEDAGSAGKGGGGSGGASGSGGADTAPRDYDLLENDGGRGCSVASLGRETRGALGLLVVTAGIAALRRRRRS